MDAAKWLIIRFLTLEVKVSGGVKPSWIGAILWRMNSGRRRGSLSLRALAEKIVPSGKESAMLLSSLAFKVKVKLPSAANAIHKFREYLWKQISTNSSHTLLRGCRNEVQDVIQKSIFAKRIKSKTPLVSKKNSPEGFKRSKEGGHWLWNETPWKNAP